MSQIACLGKCIVTLVALTWLFSNVCFWMYPHRACIKECKVTLIAFVWLFSTVSFQTCLQITCKVTPIALIWVFSGVHSQMYPQRSLSEKVHNPSIWCIFLCMLLLSNWLRKKHMNKKTCHTFAMTYWRTKFFQLTVLNKLISKHW